MICPNPNCRKENTDDNVFCEYCGTRLSANPEPHEADEVLVVFIILSVLCPLAGIILGNVNLTKKKTRSGAVYLTISIVEWLVVMVFVLLT